MLPPVVDETRKKLGKLAKSDEDVCTYIAFPALAEKYFEQREEAKKRTYSYTIRSVEEDVT